MTQQEACERPGTRLCRLLGHRRERLVFILMVRGGQWEGSEERTSPGGICRGKRGGLRQKFRLGTSAKKELKTVMSEKPRGGWSAVHPGGT